MVEPARPRPERRRDTEQLLSTAIDAWVATSGTDGIPYLIPLSHHWDGRTLLLSTGADSRIVRNIQHNGLARIAVGATRDLCLIDGEVDALPISAVDTGRTGAFAARAGFDPRTLGTRYVWLLLTPARVQAWREENEIDGRDLMVDGRWLDDEGEA